MLGPEGVSRALVDRLVTEFPDTIAGFRTRYNADEYEIPSVLHVYPTERELLTLMDFPAVFVTELETTGKLDTRQIDADGEEDLYSFRYRKRIFLFCAGDATDLVDLLRKRLALATREILLTNKILYKQDGQYAWVDGNTVRESFSEVSANGSGQFLAGAYIELEVVTEELLSAYPPPSENPTVFVVDVALPDTAPLPHSPAP